MINRKKFYDCIREELFNGRLSQLQVDGIEAILNKWEKSGYTDIRWLAYMLGTTYHETNKVMYPIEEYGKGRGKRYGTKTRYDGQKYFYPDKLYYGRGQIQLTHYENYLLMGKLLNLPLLEQPELALVPEISADIMFEGMTRGISNRGDFTGVSLEKFFNDNTEDWINARKVINGLDKAEVIASYSKRFLKCLQHGISI